MRVVDISLNQTINYEVSGGTYSDNGNFNSSHDLLMPTDICRNIVEYTLKLSTSASGINRYTISGVLETDTYDPLSISSETFTDSNIKNTLYLQFTEDDISNNFRTFGSHGDDYDGFGFNTNIQAIKYTCNDDKLNFEGTSNLYIDNSENTIMIGGDISGDDIVGEEQITIEHVLQNNELGLWLGMISDLDYALFGYDLSVNNKIGSGEEHKIKIAELILPSYANSTDCITIQYAPYLVNSGWPEHIIYHLSVKNGYIVKNEQA